MCETDFEHKHFHLELYYESIGVKWQWQIGAMYVTGANLVHG